MHPQVSRRKPLLPTCYKSIAAQLHQKKLWTMLAYLSSLGLDADAAIRAFAENLVDTTGFAGSISLSILAISSIRTIPGGVA